MSRLYPFILNMWIMEKDEAHVNNAFQKDYITEDEKQTFQQRYNYLKNKIYKSLKSFFDTKEGEV